MELEDLYAAVPAAQEEDLLEEVEHGGDAEEPEEPEDEPDEPPEEEVPPLTPGQVLGLLEHRLGAHVVEVEGPQADGP